MRGKWSVEERRAEIMRILTSRRSENLANFVFLFGVSRRTICYDIEALTRLHPIETVRGNGGCIRLTEGYGTYQNFLSQEQQETLIQIVPLIEVRYAIEVKGILISFGSKSNQSRIEGLMV